MAAVGTDSPKLYQLSQDSESGLFILGFLTKDMISDTTVGNTNLVKLYQIYSRWIATYYQLSSKNPYTHIDSSI